MNSVDARVALCGLNRRTPGFLVTEIFAHGDTKVRNIAAIELKRGIAAKGTARKLGELLR
jgi:hypothetical protein